MGCVSSKQEPKPSRASSRASKSDTNRSKTFVRPKWRSPQAITESRLKAMREEFWDTEPCYGGDRVIWDALKAACEADIKTARTIVDSAGIIVASDDLTVSYDAKGAKYELPLYVLAAPSNLAKDGSSSSSGKRAPAAKGQVELTAGS